MAGHDAARAGASCMALVERAQDWFAGPLGRFLLSQEREALERQLGHYFGGFMISYGPALPPRAKKIQHSVHLGPPLPGVKIACREDAWPLSEGSADLVLLQHGLDFSRSPHGLLREAARTVRPGGHLLIIGINPWSAWGVRRLVSLSVLRKARCIAEPRIVDWLNLLGFSVERRLFGGYCPPVSTPYWQRRLNGLESLGRYLGPVGAGYYMVSARKLVLGLRPLPKRQRNELRGQLLPLPVAKISRRDSKPGDCQ